MLSIIASVGDSTWQNEQCSEVIVQPLIALDFR